MKIANIVKKMLVLFFFLTMENYSKEITVFIALYNAEKYIEKTIESVLNQSFKDFELLIIDDASTDNSLEIVNKIDDNRIRILKNESNKGICYTRQKGLNEAIGKYFAIIDADDIMLPNRLEIQFKYLENNKDIAVCGTNAFFIDNNSSLINHVHHINTENDFIKIN